MRDPGHLLAQYRSSLLVTGAHYSITTLLGAILAQSDRFHLVHEPVNHEATISFRTVPMAHVYPLAEGPEHERLRSGLIRLMHGAGLWQAAWQRLCQVRSLRDMGRIGRLILRELPLCASDRPVIFKAPLLALSARTMQQVDGMRVILGLRHPCAWIESVVRRDSGFDFSDLARQPAVLDALPDFAERIIASGRGRSGPLHEALLLWQVIHAFHARYVIDNPRTLVVRQEDIVADPRAATERMFAFVSEPVPPRIDRFLQRSFDNSRIDFERGRGSYVRRDARGVLTKWRERMNPADQALIRSQTEELAARFGYGADDWA